MKKPLWEPGPDAAATNLAAYMRQVGATDYAELWRWSVEDVDRFWRSLWEHFELGAVPARALTGGAMPDVHWFPGVEVNFAEHLVRGEPDATAVLARDEEGNTRTLTYTELRAAVGAAQAALIDLGVEKGDRVAAVLPNGVEALVAFVATAGLGAIWSSCSPEFGARAIVDRFAQLEPKVLLAAESYAYGGKRHDRRAVLDEVRAALPGANVVERLAGAGSEPAFTPVAFEHPLWVLFSSGTTGLPKGIVHGHGGILLESLKSIRLGLDLGPRDRFFWFTTTGWMMWNVVVGSLLSGGTAVLYDGSPAQPDLLALWRLAADTGITYMGVSAGFIQACIKAGVEPARELDLSRVRAIGSTGSPLSPEGFRWIAEHALPGRPVFSTSGGTDVCTSFLHGNFMLPVYEGELSCRSLGCAVEAWDENGKPVVGEVGELVVTKPMPSMPVALWDDPDRSRLTETYYSHFPGVWRHGDWVEITERGTAILHGRSDATLNRGGVRMGTAEIYRVVEALPAVADSLVVEDARDGTSARLLLFVVPAEGREVDDALVAEIEAALRSQVSPRHVPDEVIQIDEVPRTLNGKKIEVPVKRILTGVPIEQAVALGSVANPKALEAIARLR